MVNRGDDKTRHNRGQGLTIYYHYIIYYIIIYPFVLSLYHIIILQAL